MKGNAKKLGLQLVVLLLCTAMNFSGRKLGEICHLPVWLDCVGTGVAAYFSGAVVTVLTAVLSQLLSGVQNPITLLYTVTAVVVAFFFLYCKKKKYMDSLVKLFISSFWIGMLCVLVSTPLNIIYYDGYSGNMWGDALVDMLAWYGYSPMLGAVAGELVVEIVDKQICVLLIYGIICMVKQGKKLGNRKVRAAVLSLLLVSGCMLSLTGPAAAAYAEEKPQEERSYIGTIYNNTSGMMSSEANVIAQTPDGYIWIGSYAGLTKYNGSEFEFVRDGGIVNITAMLCDSKGRLWIGTNDDGIARYENGSFTFFTIEDGLPVNSIRSLEEDERGNIYVGTTDCICRFDRNDTITLLQDSVKGIVSMAADREILAAVDHDGNLYVFKDEALFEKSLKEDSSIFCQCLKKTKQGILVGTTEDRLYRMNLSDETKLLEPLEYQVLNKVFGMEEDRNGCLWICAESGFGYVDTDGTFVELKEEAFDASFEAVMEDYQGNIWLTSSRYGVLKLSESRFLDLFKNAGVEGAVVNAVTDYQGKYYCGTDTGLVILEKNGARVQNELTELLAGERIRCLLVDSSNRLWISTYSEYGLVRYDASGDMEFFTMAENQTTSDRFRCTIELSDGTIVAGTANGINFIRGDEVVDTITVQEDGISSAQILSLVQDEDGTLYAGSDGGGIYVIRNGSVEDTYTTEHGLGSNVILRMVPYENGFFVVTGNSLCYMEHGRIHRLNNFPYFNNYDVIIVGKTGYVLSSAGIYVAEAERIAADEVMQYDLLGTGDGLVSGLTANSWSFADEEGRVFLCSNSGVIRCNSTPTVENEEFLFGIVSVECDGAKLSENEGKYLLTDDAKSIIVRGSVQNYALQDVKVKFFVEGMEETAEAVSFKKLEPIQLSNLTHGTYKVRFQLLDNSGSRVLQEKVFYLEKDMQLWEHPWYKVYLLVVGVELIIFATWTIVNMLTMSRRKNELEEIRNELEQQVESQIEQIREQEAKKIQMFRKVIIALSDTVDAKDRYTSGHSRRVAAYAKQIAARMGKSEKEQEDVYYAGLLHDVGKIRVPEAIINKPSRLTEEEFELVKIHPVTGYRILKGIAEDSPIALGAKFHHERYDGKGYPSGLRGKNIPEIARIIGVADAYDAMASNRSYRSALPQKAVRAEIEMGWGTQFDPEAAEIMLQMIDEDTSYAMKEEADMNKTILVVDDEPTNIKVIQVILKEETMYHVIGATSGEEALALLEEQEIDLVLMDIKMPGMDGFETFRRIREKSTVPVVFTTADKEIATIQRVAELGVEDYLTKPFLPAAIKEIVYGALHFSE